MIALLLVSFAMAASAPLLSRQIKNSAIEEARLNRLAVPKGSIMFFDGNLTSPANTCPNGWVSAISLYPDWEGRYPRISAFAQAGTLQEPSLPNIYGEFGQDNNLAMGYYSNSSRQKGVFRYISKGEIGAPADRNDSGRIALDASAVNSVYGADRDTSDPNGVMSEVRPLTVRLMACIKNF